MHHAIPPSLPPIFLRYLNMRRHASIIVLLLQVDPTNQRFLPPFLFPLLLNNSARPAAATVTNSMEMSCEREGERASKSVSEGARERGWDRSLSRPMVMMRI